MADFAGLILYRLNGGGRAELCVINYRKPDKKRHGQILEQLKFAGGTAKGPETPLETLAREAYEELGITIYPLDCQLVAEQTTPSDQPADGQHVRRFYATDQWNGEFRREVKHDSDEVLGPPFWLPATEYPKLFGSHRRAFQSAGVLLQTLAQADPEFWRAAYDDPALTAVLG